MSIDNEQLFNDIREIVNTRLTGGNLSTPPDFLYRWVIAAILEEHAIVPANVSSNSYHIQRFQEIVASWVTNDTAIDEVNAEQIIYHLASEGWLIVPPQT